MTIESKKFGNDVLTASEISQYKYCSVSWLLNRLGYEPSNVPIERGIIEHRNTGLKVTTIKETERFVGKMSILTIVLIAISVLLIIGGILQ